MKIKNIIIFLVLLVWLGISPTVFGADSTNTNLKSPTILPSNLDNNRLNTLENWWEFYTVGNTWASWISNLLLKIAKSMKNLFFVIASIYLIVLAIRLLFSSNTEEELWNIKKWILWSTVWLMVMQISYSFVASIYDKWVSQQTAYDFIKNIIFPLINLLELLASFFFIAIAIFAFYRMVTSGWDEEKIKTGKMSIFQWIIWFIIIKISWGLVESIYGKLNCEEIWWVITLEWRNCIEEANLGSWVQMMTEVINWVNWFVGIATVLMIIYAGWLIMLSGGDEEKMKKWKSMILYIAIWLLILASSYLLLTFFIIPESKI